MDPDARDRFLHRSRPVLGAVGGFLIAAEMHLFGVPETAGAKGFLTTLFETSPLPGYALFVGAGTFIALAFRVLQDRYVYR